MKTFRTLILLTLTLISLNSRAQNADNKFSFEFNIGPSLAISDIGGTDLKPGAGFEALFSYRFMPHVSAYAGWGWNRFASDEAFSGANADFEETGYIFGLQFSHPVNDSRLSLLLRLGGLYNHIEIENNSGDITYDTGHGLGLQAAAGVEYRFGESWSLSPIVKFHTLSRDLDVDGANTDLDLRYLGLRVGIIKRF